METQSRRVGAHQLTAAHQNGRRHAFTIACQRHFKLKQISQLEAKRSCQWPRTVTTAATASVTHKKSRTTRRVKHWRSRPQANSARSTTVHGQPEPLAHSRNSNRHTQPQTLPQPQREPQQQQPQRQPRQVLKPATGTTARTHKHQSSSSIAKATGREDSHTRHDTCSEVS